MIISKEIMFGDHHRMGKIYQIISIAFTKEVATNGKMKVSHGQWL
jgi:hypothetical protein